MLLQFGLGQAVTTNADDLSAKCRNVDFSRTE
jgi:hypothetical protein